MQTSRRPSRWVSFPRARRVGRVRLFCFPHAGGSAAIYCFWSRQFPEDIEVCPVNLPGRGARLEESPCSRLLELAGAVTRELTPFLDVPFALFGHSMGALLSFEIARELERREVPAPLCLFASGYRAPQIPPGPPIHHLPKDELLAAVERRYGAMPDAVIQSRELMEFVLPVLRADMEMCETYAYENGQPLSCPIQALGGTDDSWVGRSHLLPWREQTRAAFTLRMFPGDHFFVQTAEHWVRQTLSADLQRMVDRDARTDDPRS